jgi:hypothetical protein
VKLKKALTFLGLGFACGAMVGVALGVGGVIGWLFTLVFWTVMVYFALGVDLA